MKRDEKLASAAPRLAVWGGAIAAATVLALGGLSVADPTPAPAVEPVSSGGPAVMRRLTEAQYRASVADIFGADIPIVGRFEHGIREGGLLAVGASKSGISPFAMGQYDASARGVADAVTSEAHRAQVVPCRPRSATAFDSACATQFVNQYGPVLFRRPITGEERTRYVQAARAATQRLSDFYKGLNFALAGMMVAPEFLFRVERAEPVRGHPGELQLDAYSKASQLSFFLTNSAPDAELLRAAGAGELNTGAGLARQADRLIASPRYQRAVRTFFRDMFQFDGFDDLSKDPVIYPAFNSIVARDAQEQTMRTIAHLLITERGDYRDLYTTRETSLTRSLGTIYRMPVATRNGWEAAQYPVESGRAGILTDVSFLALHSHPGRSSSTLRGKSIRELVLCQAVPDPPPNVDFTIVQDSSNTALPTARDRLTAHRTQPLCASCHRIMDPIGLTLENFDGSGGYRATENGATINAAGSLDGHEFTNAAGLGQAIHDHPQTPRCLVSKLYRSAVGRDTSQQEAPYVAYLNQSFQANGYRLPDLMRTIAVSRTFYAVSAPATPPQRASAQPNGGRS